MVEVRRTAEYIRKNYARDIEYLKTYEHMSEDAAIKECTETHKTKLYATIYQLICMEQGYFQSGIPGYPIRKAVYDKRISNYTIGKIYVYKQYNKLQRYNMNKRDLEKAYPVLGKEIRATVKRADKYKPDFVRGTQRDVNSFKWYIFHHLKTQDIKDFIGGKGMSDNALSSMYGGIRLDIAADIILMYPEYITNAITAVEEGKLSYSEFATKACRYIKFLRECSTVLTPDSRVKGVNKLFIGREIYASILKDVDRDVVRLFNLFDNIVHKTTSGYRIGHVADKLKWFLQSASRGDAGVSKYWQSYPLKSWGTEGYSKAGYYSFYRTGEIDKRNYMDDLKDISVPLQIATASPYISHPTYLKRIEQLI